MGEGIIGQYRIFGEAQKHQFGQTLTVSSLENKEQFFLYKFPAFRALPLQRSCCENLITKWNETLNTSMLSGREDKAETALPRLEIIENSLFSIRPFIEGVWLNLVPPLSISHALQVFQQVGRELAVFHERGWIHGMLEADHILLDGAGEAHLITPPLSLLEKILQEHSHMDLTMERLAVTSGEEALVAGISSVSTDVSRLLSLVYQLFASSEFSELTPNGIGLRGELREGLPLQLETVLAQLSDVSERNSICSVTQLIELVSGCFSPRMKRRAAMRRTLRGEETHNAVGNESSESPRGDPQRQQEETEARQMTQGTLSLMRMKRFFTETLMGFEFLVAMCTKCTAQWVSLLPFFAPLRAGLLSAGICSFIISVALLVAQAGHQVPESAKPDWQGDASDRSSDTKDKRRDYALTEVPLPKFFEEYGGDEYGGLIE